MDLKRTIGTTLKVIFLFVLVYFCVAYLVPKWEALELTGHIRKLPIGWIVAAGVLLFLHYIYIFALWVLLLRLLGSRRPEFFPVLRAYALSLLPKYIPGKVVAHGVKAQLALQAGLPGATVSSSLIWEAALVLGSAALVGILGFLGPDPASMQEAARWLILVFALGAGAFVVVGSTRMFGSRWKEWVGFPQMSKRPMAVIALFALYVVSWLSYGLSHWFLAKAVVPTHLSDLLPLSVALAVSWGLGFISLIAPAGLGVREGVLYLFILGWMTEGQALLFVTLSRILSFAVELSITVLWWILHLANRGPGKDA